MRAELPFISSNLPEGMRVEVAHDTSVFIQASINSVFHTIGEAVVLVVIVVFIFLRNVRATLIPVVTIPASLLGAFAIMYLLGFTVNTLTLLAMVLAIGLVVDDAIVVLENIYRHIEEGMAPMAAAFQGSKEIGFAVVAMTLTLAAVYAPIGFMSGTTGRLFTEFAWALAGAVIISGFVALTLSPMMCSRMLKHQASHGWMYNMVERALVGLTNGYRAALRGTLKIRPLVLLVGLVFAGEQLFRLQDAEARALAGRGSRHHHQLLHRPRRRDHQFHGEVCQALRGDVLQGTRSAGLLRRVGQPHCLAGHFVHPADAHGTSASASSRTSSRRLAPNSSSFRAFSPIPPIRPRSARTPARALSGSRFSPKANIPSLTSWSRPFWRRRRSFLNSPTSSRVSS